MADLWFAIVALMLMAYVVLDGFDFGAGTLHLFVAKTDQERRQVLSAIGPFWDGNEVWLLASGGALFVAFPKVLAAGLSGFYFAIFFVLWTLILRGVSIEFRSHVDHPLWRAVWDAVFAVSSTLMPVLLGAALGNLLRGVPLNRDGWFSLDLFTDFTASGDVGILDWFTVLVGAFGAIALAGHGATFLAWRTGSAVQLRARDWAWRCYAVCGLLWPVVTLATAVVNRSMYEELPRRPVAWLALAVALGGLCLVFRGLRRDEPLEAFLGSSAFLAGLLGATAALIFPVMLRSTTDQPSLTVSSSAAPLSSLQAAFTWWIVAAPLAVAYFVTIFRLHRRQLG